MEVPRKGGLESPRKVGPNEQKMLDQVKAQVESKLGLNFTSFKGLTFQTQVVAGLIFIFTVQVDNGKTVRVKLFKPLSSSTAKPMVLEAVIV